jgi:hypothetical protein
MATNHRCTSFFCHTPHSSAKAVRQGAVGPFIIEMFAELRQFLLGIFQRRKPRRHSGILDSFPLQRRAPILNRQAMEFNLAQLYQFWLSHASR